MKAWDDLTIVLPCWNHGVLLAKTLATLCTQQLRAARILFLDDGSTDDSVAVASGFPVEVVRNERRLGVGPTLNRGFELATTPWVLCFSADDLAPRDFIFQHRRALEQVPAGRRESVALLYSAAFYFVEGKGRVGHFGGFSWRPGAIQDANFVHGCSMVRRDIWERCGRFRDEPHEDWELWKRIDAAGFIGVRAETALFYRQHGYGHRNYGTDKVREGDWKGGPVRAMVRNTVFKGAEGSW